MRKIILDAIIEKLEQVGNLERIDQPKRASQNAFKLNGKKYKRSDLYPMILSIPNPEDGLEEDANYWIGQSREHIVTGEREVPLEDLKAAWMCACGLEEYRLKDGKVEDKTRNLQGYIYEHDAVLRMLFRKMVSEDKFYVNNKQYDVYTAMQWLVWIMVIEEKEHFFLHSKKHASSKYDTNLKSYQNLPGEIFGRIRNGGNVFLLYGKRFIGKTVFVEDCLLRQDETNKCYLFDCGQKSFLEFLKILRNKQDNFWNDFHKQEKYSHAGVPYDTESIGVQQNMCRLKEVSEDCIVVWDNIAACDLQSYIEGIVNSGFLFKSVLVVDLAVIGENIRRYLPENHILQIPSLTEQEMRSVASHIIKKVDRSCKSRFSNLPQDCQEYMGKLIMNLNGNIALMELVIRNYLAIQKQHSQEEAEKFLLHLQDYKDILPSDRKSANFKKTGTTSSFDNNVRYVFRESISGNDRLKITILSLLNGKRVHRGCLWKYFKICKEDMHRYLMDGMTEEEGDFVIVRIHPVIPELLFPFLRKNNQDLEGNYSNDELKECLEYVIRLIADLMKFSPQSVDEAELLIIVDAVIKRIYLILCENEGWFTDHFDEYFTLMLQYRLFLTEYNYFGSDDSFLLRIANRDVRINGKCYHRKNDVYDKELTELKKSMLRMMDWQRMYKETQERNIFKRTGERMEDFVCAGEEIRKVENQIEKVINLLTKEIKHMIYPGVMLDHKKFWYDMHNLESLLEPVIGQRLDSYFMAMYWYFNAKDEKRYKWYKNNYIAFVNRFLHPKKESPFKRLLNHIQRVYGYTLAILRGRGHITVKIFQVKFDLIMKEKLDIIQAICLQYLSLECLCESDHNKWMNSLEEFQGLYINLQEWMDITEIKDLSLRFMVGIVNTHFMNLVDYVNNLQR